MFAVSMEEKGPVLVEIGSGQVKIFHAGKPVKMMDFSGIEGASPFDIQKFMEKLKSDSGQDAFDYLQYFFPLDLQKLEKVYFGTAGLRKLEEETGKEIDKIRVLTQEEEARCEAYAADYCTAICDNFDLTYAGNFGYGNGSGQGYIRGEYKSQGLRTEENHEIIGCRRWEKVCFFRRPRRFQNFCLFR